MKIFFRFLFRLCSRWEFDELPPRWTPSECAKRNLDTNAADSGGKEPVLTLFLAFMDEVRRNLPRKGWRMVKILLGQTLLGEVVHRKHPLERATRPTLLHSGLSFSPLSKGSHLRWLHRTTGHPAAPREPFLLITE